LNQIKDELVGYIISNLTEIQIPTISDDIGPSWLNLDGEVKDLVLDDISIDIASSTITFEPSFLVILNIQDISTSGSGEFKYDYIFGSGSGSIDISVSDTDVVVNIAIGRLIANDKLSIYVEDCDTNIGSLDIDIHGSTISDIADWLANEFKDDL